MRYEPPNQPAAPPTDPCLVCARRRTHDTVCDNCRTGMVEQIDYLAGALVKLPLAQIPGQGGGERVRTSRTAPLPLRLDPLSMTADGHDDDEVQQVFVPQVEEIRGAEDGKVIRRRFLVPAGDQGGMLPLPVWARAWTLDIRQALGHSIPARPELKLRPAAPEPRPVVGKAWVSTPASRAALANYVAGIQDAAMRELARDRLGLAAGWKAREVRDDRGAIRYEADPDMPDDAEPDPVAREWVERYGQARDHLQYMTDMRYLRMWLAEACVRYGDIAGFAASLRALHVTVRRVLGDFDDKLWLGRCPVGHHDEQGRVFVKELYDRDSDVPTVCGAGLWREPFASMVQCPRCHHETPERDLVTLSGWIRAAWPVDRRRRYTLDEVDEVQYATGGKRMGGLPGPPLLRMPCCVDCGRPVAVEWKECTERGDVDTGPDGRRQTRRMWRVVRTFCPWRGCGVEEREAS